MNQDNTIPLNPEQLLRTLALGLDGEEAPSDTDLKNAVMVLSQPGMLALAYSLVDQAVLLAQVSGDKNPERYAQSPLAQLLDRQCEEELGEEEPALVPAVVPKEQSVAKAANDDDENSGGAKIIRMFGPATAFLAAAAAVLFFVRADPDEGPGVKAGPGTAKIVASVMSHDGPLTESELVKGLDVARKSLSACKIQGPAVVELNFMVTDLGVVGKLPGNEPDAVKIKTLAGTLSPGEKDCLAKAVQKAAFDFKRTPTVAMMRLEFRVVLK